MDDRVAELELQFMEQQRLLSDLSDQLYAQQKEITALRSAVLQLQQKIQADPGIVDPKQDDRPPHY